MTDTQVPEPTAEQYAIARQIVVGLRTLTDEPLRSDSFEVAAEVARAIAAAVAAERAKYVTVAEELDYYASKTEGGSWSDGATEAASRIRDVTQK